MDRDEQILAGEQIEQSDGYFLLQETADGIELVVFPERGGRPVRAEEIRKELALYGIEEYDAKLVEETVLLANGRPVRIAAQCPGAVDGRVMARTSQDQMTAEVKVLPPLGQGRPADRPAVLRALEEAGVKRGIDQDRVNQALEPERAGQWLTVARGQPAVAGQDARITLHFAGRSDGRPRELADGRVDFYDLNLINNVRAGDRLASKEPATPGQAGFTVTGTELSPKAGRDKPLGAGKNVELAEGGLELRATIDGHVVVGQGGRISVFPVYEVRGDVDFSTGNIEFVGSVVVRGGVASGFKVKATGDISVSGYVDSATLEAGGSISVNLGVQGRNKGHLKAGGRISARFIENGTVEAGSRVEVADAIMHSQVSAGESVRVEGRKGLIVGGTIKARDEVVAKVIGASLGTITEIEVGVDPRLREEQMAVAAQKREIEESLDKAGKAITLLRDLEASGQLSPDRRELLLKLIRSQFQLKGQLTQVSERWNQIEAEINARRRGSVSASQTIHPGTRITIGSAHYTVRDELSRVSLSLGEDGQVKLGPYSPGKVGD